VKSKGWHSRSARSVGMTACPQLKNSCYVLCEPKAMAREKAKNASETRMPSLGDSLSCVARDQFFCPMAETRSAIRESILRKSFRRPFSGFSLRLRTTIVRSRIWCSIPRETCSIGPHALRTARQTSRSFSSRASSPWRSFANRDATREGRLQAS
jgi:hypothetical protein